RARAGTYAVLRFAVDTTAADRGALMQRVEEQSTAIATRAIFFELEWAEVPDGRAAALLSDDALEFCAHYLRSARRYRPHLLTEPEEKILAEKAIASHSAWSRLFGELVAALRVTLDDEEELSLEVALSRLQSPDREQRRTAA